jgi:predicted amidohydrolase
MVCRLHGTAENRATACRLSREAARQGARLIVFPEGCLTGNALSGPDQQAVLPVEPGAFEDLSRVASACGITICAGFITSYGAGFNTAQAIIEPSGAVRFQRKAFRANTEPPFLRAWPDPAREVFEVEGVRVAIAICSEFGAPGVREALAQAAPDLVLHPSAGSMKPEQVWHDGEPLSPAMLAFDPDCRLVVTRAAEAVKRSGLPKMGTNPIGFDGETWWPGNSYAVDGGGRVVLWLKGRNKPVWMQSSVAVADMAL